MDNDDIATLGVFLFFIVLFVLWIILKRKLGEKRTYQLLFIIAWAISILYLLIERTILMSLFTESIVTIVIVLLGLIGGTAFWIYAIKKFLNK